MLVFVSVFVKKARLKVHFSKLGTFSVIFLTAFPLTCSSDETAKQIKVHCKNSIFFDYV